MSYLHHELINKYKKYEIISESVYLKKHRYLFNIISNSKIIMGGIHIILGTYDFDKNIFIWADNSNILDRIVIKEIRNIRSKLLESYISDEYIKYINKDIIVITSGDMMNMLSSISDVLQKDIIINFDKKNQHIHIIQKILTDNR